MSTTSSTSAIGQRPVNPLFHSLFLAAPDPDSARRPVKRSRKVAVRTLRSTTTTRHGGRR